MNNSQYEWVKIWLKILQLKAIGGTDYTSAFNTLITDATELASTMNRYDRRVAWIQMLRAQAMSAGSVDASLFAGTSGLFAAVSCCLTPYSDIEAVNLLLECKLGIHKAYPQ